jgi:hypothetical protein
MKKLKLALFFSAVSFALSCGSNSDNESLSNPRQTDDPNARNPISDSIADSLNRNRTIPAATGDMKMP